MAGWLRQEAIKQGEKILDKPVLVFGGTSEGRNSIRDHPRKIKEIDLETDFEAEKYDDGGIDKKIEQLSVWEALSSLEELEKEILILRYYQDHIIKEISEIMGMPASTIRYKLKNAEKTLKSRLEL